MMTRFMAVSASALMLMAVATHAAYAADGAALFDQECADCHSVKGKNKKGPTLAGVVGRKSASVADFTNYSDAMKAKAIVWTPDKIDAYIKNPRAFLPGGTMKYDGMADADSRAAIIAYLSANKS